MLFVSRLLRQGEQGWVWLVNDATGAAVAKRRIESPARPLSRRLTVLTRRGLLVILLSSPGCGG
jgi:hypothetical protein